jgi:hypothetical protein
MGSSLNTCINICEYCLSFDRFWWNLICRRNYFNMIISACRFSHRLKWGLHYLTQYCPLYIILNKSLIFVIKRPLLNKDRSLRTCKRSWLHSLRYGVSMSCSCRKWHQGTLLYLQRECIVHLVVVRCQGLWINRSHEFSLHSSLCQSQSHIATDGQSVSQ